MYKQISSGKYTIHLIGERHDEVIGESKQQLIEVYDKKAVFILEAPYVINPLKVNKKYIYEETSHILQLQNKYNHCLCTPDKSDCPALLFYVDIRCCDIGETLLAQECLSQLAYNKIPYDLQLVNLLKQEVPTYIKQFFAKKWQNSLSRQFLSYLPRTDATPYLLIKGRHPISFHLKQLRIANPILHDKWMQCVQEHIEQLMTTLPNNLDKLVCLLVDILVITKILLLVCCQPLAENILVVMGMYHIAHIDKYLQLLI
jgi:hypothetical protein